MQISNNFAVLGTESAIRENTIKKRLKISGQNEREFQNLILKPDIDTYRSSALDVSPVEFKMIYNKDGTAYGYIDKKEAEQLWAAAEQKYRDEPFKLYAKGQNLVFSQKLHEYGFFEGMSEEESGQFEELLADITEVMNRVNRAVSPEGYMSAGVSWGSYTDMDVCGSYIMPSSWEAKGELESASAALRLFCDKYIDKEHQEEFYSLIDDFHAYNTKYLSGYESWSEKMSRTNALLYFYDTGEQEKISSEDRKRAVQEYDAQKKQAVDAYVKSLSAMFQRMRETGAVSDELWRSMSGEYQKCIKELSKGISWKGWEKEQENGEMTFLHMKKYWAKLITA